MHPGGANSNPPWLELPPSRTNFHGPKGVRLYLVCPLFLLYYRIQLEILSPVTYEVMAVICFICWCFIATMMSSFFTEILWQTSLAGLSGSVGCVSNLWSGGHSSIPTWFSNILSCRLIMKYFLWSFSPFRWFKKGSCQFLAKELVNCLED